MRPWLRVVVAGAVALAGLAALVLGFAALTGDDKGPAGPPSAAVSVQTAVAPTELHFGDPIQASVLVLVDRARVDPASVRITPAFAGYQPTASPVRRRTDGEGKTTVTASYRLLCLTGRCTPTQDVLRERFAPVSVTYVTRSSGEPATIEAPWRGFVVRTRLDAQIAQDQLQPDGTFSNSSPWRAELAAVPAVSYRVAPGSARWLLLGASLLLVLAAAGLLYRALPRWAPPVEPEPEPEPEPDPDPTPPLEQALEVLESPVEATGASGRRRALELVADAVASRGDADLAHAARALAWSEDAPEQSQTKSLAALVRMRLERDTNGAAA